MATEQAKKTSIFSNEPFEAKIIHLRNPQLIPIPHQTTHIYYIAIKCKNSEAAVELRKRIDPQGQKTRSKSNIIYIIQGFEHDFTKRFPDILKVIK